MLIIATAEGRAAYINGLSIWMRNNNERLVGSWVVGICLASFPVLSWGPLPGWCCRWGYRATHGLSMGNAVGPHAGGAPQYVKDECPKPLLAKSFKSFSNGCDGSVFYLGARTVHLWVHVSAESHPHISAGKVFGTYEHVCNTNHRSMCSTHSVKCRPYQNACFRVMDGFSFFHTCCRYLAVMPVIASLC